MKIILLLNQDIHAAKALNLLLKNLKKHEVKIILSKKVGKKNSLPKDLMMMKKHEQLPTPSLRGALAPKKYLPLASLRASASEAWQSMLTFNQIAEFFGNKTKFYKDINSKTAVTDFKKFAPDLVISIRFGQILKDEIIATAKHGVINLHSGILPGYRGVLATFWAILKGEKEIGSTLHYIENSKIDDGKIIKINKQKVDKKHSLIFNIASLYKDGAAAIIEVIEKIEGGKKIKTTSPKTLGADHYFSFPNEEDVKQFQKLLPLYNEADIKSLHRHWK